MASRFVVEIPLTWASREIESDALARMRTAQAIQNEVLAEYLRRVTARSRDVQLTRLRAENAAVKRGKNAVQETVTPRKISFSNARTRSEAWRLLNESHGLIGAVPIVSLSDAGAEWYKHSKAFARGLTARQLAFGVRGLDAATIHHELIATQRDRVLESIGVKPRKSATGIRVVTGRPKFASRRDPIRSVTGSSSAKNRGALRVDLEQRVFKWAAAGGLHVLTGHLRFPKRDGWLRQAIAFPIAQVRVLHRVIRGKRRWYVQLVLVGAPPLKRRLVDRLTTGTVGVDLGVRHVAAAGERGALLVNLAPHAIQRERMRDADVVDARDGDRVKGDRYLRRMQRHISRRLARHPANRDCVKTVEKTLVRTADGKAIGKAVNVEAGFRKGSRLTVSARVASNRAQLAEIHRADAAARKNDHGRIANETAMLGDRINLERLSYVAWQRAFGRQSRRYAPGAFIARLKWRMALVGGSVVEIPTSLMLSQLCHGCGTYRKTPIRGPIAHRMSPACGCGREAVHRDLYSAFLARFVAPETSVDLQAASAAWGEHFELLSGARRMYDRAEMERLRCIRIHGESVDDSVPVPHARVGAQALSADDPTHLAPASVRDGGERARLVDVERFSDEQVAPQDRSTSKSRASSSRSGRQCVCHDRPARRSLETVAANAAMPNVAHSGHRNVDNGRAAVKDVCSILVVGFRHHRNVDNGRATVKSAPES